tara:strand:+ start:378 stop:569 length:192 start_codon:yes stop_codon:yes gene_type:complete
MINRVEKIYVTIGKNSTPKFTCFKVNYENELIKIVPNNEANTDYQAIQEWAKIEGNNIIDPGA